MVNGVETFLVARPTQRQSNVERLLRDMGTLYAAFREMYENMYRLRYLRGPEGIMLALAEELGKR